MAGDEERAAQAASQPGEGAMSEDELDRNLAETFPASDPPSWTLGTDHQEDSPGGRRDDDEGGEAE